MEENLVQIDDLIAIASCSENIVLFIQEKDIETPGTIAIQANFRYGQFHIDNIDNFLRFTRFEEIKNLSIRKGYVIKLQQAFSDDDLLKMLVQLSLKEVSTNLDTLEKGKVAQIGETREWSGQKMKKTAEGWVPISEEQNKTNKDEQSSDKNKQTGEKQYSEQELSEFAKQTSESNLKQVASGKDEQLRIAAKKELERRDVEESPQKQDESIKETKENKDTVLHKKKQLEIILNNNPSPDEIHTWIRKEEDIKTAEEAFNESIESDESTPDFKKEDMENALKEGSVTIYSSYPIRDGAFVTPSKMEAQSYAGKKDVFSKKVNLDDIAWIDGLQGQFAPINKTEEIKKDSKDEQTKK